MIELHRLTHPDEPFYLNPDMIQTIEAKPDSSTRASPASTPWRGASAFSSAADRTTPMIGSSTALTRAAPP